MSSDWRNEADYEYIDDLDVAGLAWECLRRNRRYRSAFATMSERDAAAWGLRFPGRSGPQRKACDRLMDASRGAGRRSSACRTARYGRYV
ncbi:MAG: DUF6499 domain-containing protein [Pseudomonadota bacterium]